MADFVGNDRLEIVLARADRAGIGPRVPIPAWMMVISPAVVVTPRIPSAMPPSTLVVPLSSTILASRPTEASTRMMLAP